MSLLSIFAVTFLSAPEKATRVVHVGPTVLTLLCAGVFMWACFSGLISLKGLWFVRRELQPWRAAIPVLIRTAVCALVAIGALIVYNLFVAGAPGSF